MEEKQRIIDMIKSKIESDFEDDVAIFAIYGSYATGDDDAYSDIDFFFIPKTDRATALSNQFIIDGIGYDLFPVSWERVAEIAAFNQPLMPIITESKVLYAASDEDLNRYEDFRSSILNMRSPEAEHIMLQKSYEYFNETYIYLYHMKSEATNLIDLRVESSKIISKIVTALAFANQTFYKGGMGTNVKESFKLEKIPRCYQALIEVIISAEDDTQLVDATEKLIKNTRQFLWEQIKTKPERESFEALFAGFYEEFKSVINKMLRACEQEDEYTAFQTAAYFHEEVAQFLAKAEEGIWYNDRNYYSEYSKSFESFIDVDFMHMVAKRDFSALKDAVMQFEARLIDLLVENGVSITSYDSIDEFAVDYQKQN